MLTGAPRWTPWRPSLIAAAVWSLIIVPPAHASPCWKAEVINAARIHELQVMIMAGALRCRVVGFDITESYENFIAGQNAGLSGADQLIRAHFGADVSKARRGEYMTYMTRIANSYGVGINNAKSCRAFKDLADSLADTSATEDDLSARSFELIRDPQLDSEPCPFRR